MLDVQERGDVYCRDKVRLTARFILLHVIRTEMKLNTDMQAHRVSDEIWEVPPSEKPGILVPHRIYATQGILQTLDRGVFDQATNVACLPGIRRYALCKPDVHWIDGFPIGGVAAFDVGSR